MDKIDNIQSLRAIACVFVCLNHFNLINANTYGSIGVEYFFIISGYLTLANFYNKGYISRRYLVDKVVKIMPIYWIMTLIVFLIGLIFPFLFSSLSFTMENLFCSMFLIPGHEFFLYPGWTLTYMFLFYFMFYVTYLFHKTCPEIIASIMIVGLIVVYNILPDEGMFNTAKAYCNPIMIEFLYGMMAYRIVTFVLTKMKRIKTIKGTAIGYTLVVMSFFITKYFECRYFVPAIFVTIVIMIFVLTEIKSSKWLVYIGDLSYVIYIIHPLLIRPIDKIMNKLFANNLGISVISIFFSVVIVIICAYLFRRFVQMPLEHKLVKCNRKLNNNV